MAGDEELYPVTPSPQKGRVFRNQEVRIAFRQAASSHNDEMTINTIPEVLSKLDVMMDAEELQRRFPYQPNHIITYDEFVSAMGDILFGYRIRPFDVNANETTPVDATPTTTVLTKWMNDLLNLGRDALSTPVPVDQDVYDEMLLDGRDTEESPQPFINNSQLAQRMKDASEAERMELRQDRQVALEKLQLLNDELGLSEQQYMSLQSVAEAMVEAFRVKQKELDRYKDLTADLIQRLRQRTMVDRKNYSDENGANMSQSSALLEKLQTQLIELQEAAKDNPDLSPLVQQCQQTLTEAAEATKKEAQMRRGIAEDNGWLWMQVTQLQKQIEQQYVARAAKVDSSSSCIIQ